MKSFLVLILAALCLSTPTPSDLVPVAQDEKRAVDLLVQGYWSCSIPNNNPKVAYTQMRQQLGVCGGTGLQYQYFITYASDNLVSCSLPDPSTGWTYSYVRDNLGSCEIARFARQYTLRKPYNGLQACNIPSVFTYTGVISTSNCQMGRDTAAYVLQAPLTGLSACSLPTGWTYSSKRDVYGVCTLAGTKATQYILNKA